MLMQNSKGRGAQPADSSRPPATKSGQSLIYTDRTQIITAPSPTFLAVFYTREEIPKVTNRDADYFGSPRTCPMLGTGATNQEAPKSDA